MLPLKKFTSKPVVILLIVFVSTSFGFLDNPNRDYESRRSFRSSRVSMDREFSEKLPFRRDNNRRANEKDVIYENLYDRRSFRTGTDRHIRNQDRERISNIKDRHLTERYVLFNRDNRIRDQNYRLLDNRSQLDRSRSLIENGRRTNRFDRNIRQQRERDVEIRNRNERKIREVPSRENVDRVLGNRQSVGLKPESFSRDNRREIREHRNGFDSRINEVRHSRNLRELASRISYREREMSSRRNTVGRERNLENRRHYRNYRVDDVERASRSSSSVEQRSRRLNERLTRDVGSQRSTENRHCDLDRKESQASRGTSGLRSSRLYRDTNERNMRIREGNSQRESREHIPMAIRESRSREQSGERHFDRSFRQYRYDNLNENRQNSVERRDLHERNPSMNRVDSRRTRMVLRTQNRYRNDYITRDRALNRPISNDLSRNNIYGAVLSRRDSTRQMLNAQINSVPARNTEHDSSSTISTSNQRNVDSRLPTATDSRRSLKTIDQRDVPVVEYVPNSGRSFERVSDVQQSKTLFQNLKFDALANVIQVILGVYLIGQIFAHSSKKKYFGYQSIIPSLNSMKNKLD